MNNAKASNAILAMADAMAAMAADYEQQIGGLKQSNEVIVRELKSTRDQITKAHAVFERLLYLPELEGFMFPTALLNDWPWPIPILNRDGSSGPPPTPPTSKGDTPSG